MTPTEILRRRLTAAVNEGMRDKQLALYSGGFAHELPSDRVASEYMLRVGELRGIRFVMELLDEIDGELNGATPSPRSNPKERR